MRPQYPRPMLPALAWISVCCMIFPTECFQFNTNYGGGALRTRYQHSQETSQDAVHHRSYPQAGAVPAKNLRVQHKRSSGTAHGVHPAVGPRMVGRRSGGVSGETSFLQIKEAPAKLVEAREHGEAVLECAAAGSPAPHITWYKDGRPLAGHEKTMLFSGLDLEGQEGQDPTALAVTRSRIVLDCVTEADAGFYECVADQGGLGKSEAVGTEVSVVSFGTGSCTTSGLGGVSRSPPKITQWMETYMIEMGRDAVLHCSTEGALATMWIGPDENPIRDEAGGKYKVLADGSLVIADLTFNDMGIYQCVVKNKFGHDMAETFLYPMAPM